MIELSGKCILKINTGKSNMTVEIPKLNHKTGENNADSLIGEVLHFAIMRHGRDKAKQIFDEKLSKYGEVQP